MDADKDLNFAMGWNRFNLKLVGIWPDPLEDFKRTSRFSWFSIRFLISSVLMLSFICIPQSVNLIFVWGNADMITENLATANIPVTNAFMKGFVVWHRRKVLVTLVNYFYQDWHALKTSKERTTMLQTAENIRRISIWCTILTQSMLTFYVLLKIVMIFKLQGSNSTRPLIYTAYFPFDTTQSPVFEIICVGQIIAAYGSTCTYTGINGFICMLVLHTCSQFQNLQERLKNLINNHIRIEALEDFKKELKQIVKRHEHLNWFAKTIEESFNMMFLIEILSCTIQLCFQGFQFFQIIKKNENEFPIFQLLFLVAFVAFILIHLYVYCYIGEMLLVQSTQMGLSTYESNWYNIPGKEARNLLFIMRRSIIPLSLTAGNFSVFSLEMFSKILKTSVGYLSVLLTVTD